MSVEWRYIDYSAEGINSGRVGMMRRRGWEVAPYPVRVSGLDEPLRWVLPCTREALDV